MNDSWLDDPSLYVKPKTGSTPDFDDPSLYKPAPKKSQIAASVAGIAPLFAGTQSGAMTSTEAPVGSEANPIITGRVIPNGGVPGIQPGRYYRAPDGVVRRVDTNFAQDVVGGVSRGVRGLTDFITGIPADVQRAFAETNLRAGNSGFYGGGTGNPFPVPEVERSQLVADSQASLNDALRKQFAAVDATQKLNAQFPVSNAREKYHADMAKAKGAGGVAKAILGSPLQTSLDMGESLGPFIPSIVAGAVNPSAGAAAGAATMAEMESQRGAVEYLLAHGIPLDKATDQDIQDALRFANTRAGVMAAAGLLPVGQFARIPLGAAERAGLSPALHEGANLLLGTGATGAQWGGAEAAAEAATGQELDPAKIAQQAITMAGQHLASGAIPAARSVSARNAPGLDGVTTEALKRQVQDPSAPNENRLAAALALMNRGEKIEVPSATASPENAGAPSVAPAPPDASQGQPAPATSPATPSPIDSLLLKNILGAEPESAPQPTTSAANIPWESAAAALGLTPKPTHADPFLDAARLAAQGLRPDGAPVDGARPVEPVSKPEPATAQTPTEANPARALPIPEAAADHAAPPTEAPAVEPFVRKYQPSGRKDSKGRDIVEPVVDLSHDGLLQWLGANGGVDFEAVRAQGGADPALMRDPAVARPFGRVGMPALRRNGGMGLDALVEKMQQDGWLPENDGGRPAQVEINDALNLVMDAINGHPVTHPVEGQDLRHARMEDARREAVIEEDGLAQSLGFRDAEHMGEVASAANDRQRDRQSFSMEDVHDARSLDELFSDPAVQEISPAQFGRILALPEPQQAAALWKLIDERRTEHGVDAQANDRGDSARPGEAQGRESADTVRQDAEPFTLKQRGSDPQEVTSKPAQSGQLFGEPTARDHVDAAVRAKDAERDGRNTDGRTDMAAGDGELFAGDRPGQGRIESSRDMFASYPKDGETNGRERQDQTGNGRSDLDSGRASAGGGDAGGVGLRADATPSLTQRGKYAVESLVRRFGGSVLADKLNRSFRETDTARLIGQKISADPAKAAHDLAAISEVYRNPIFETLRYIFADKDGNILGETAVESRMPSSSAAFPTGEDGVDFIIRNAPDGATHLWLQHNHPSGNPTPSPADVYLTRGLALKLREAGAGIEIAGHVVLNHKTYAFIPHDADPRTFNRDYSVNPIDRPDVNDPLIADRGLSGQRIGNDADAARIGANYLRQIKKDSFVLISTDAKGAVALVSAFPLRALGNPKALGLAAQLGKRSGAYRQFVVMHDTNIPADIRQQVVKALDAGMRSGAIADVVSADGTQHPVIKHSRIVNSGNHIETMLGRNGRGDRAVKVYEEDSGYRMTPEQESFMRKAGLHGAQDTRTLPERAKDWLSGKLPESWKDHLIQGGFDQYYGLRKASEAAGLSPEESPYYAARLINNASTMEAVLRFGAPKLVDGTLRVDRGVKGLMDALEPVKDSMPQFLGWMVARRAQLLKQQGREHLMTDADIRAGLSLRQGHEQAFDRAALNYLKLKNAVLDLAEKTGVIDPVARAAWDHAEYIPFYREGDAGGAGTRRGLSNQSSGIRTLKGGDAAIRDPLSNIVQNFTRLVDASMKNRTATLAVDKLSADLFDKVPMDATPALIPLDQVKRHLLDTGVDRATVDAMPAAALKGMSRMLSIKPPEGDDVIRIMRGGKAEYYRVKDPFLLTALTAMHETPTPAFVKMLAWPKHLLTAGATMTPDFMVANMLRDTGEAAVTSKDHFIPVWDTLRGAVDAFRHDELAQDLMMAGASFHGGYFRTGDAEATSSAIRKALSRGGHDRSFIDKYVKTLASPARLKDLYFDLLGATEQGSRLSTAKRRLDAGGSFADAAFEAKDLLDFQLRGAASSVRVFTQILPFLNARMQGAYRLGRIGTTKGRRNAVAARLAAMALTSTALYAINSELFGQGYDDLEDWDKDTNWHIAPGTEYHTRIPKPFELGLIGGTLPERMYGAIRYQLGKEDNADRPGQSVDSMIRAMTGVLELNPIPQAAKPIVEDWANRDMYFNRAIESQGDKFRSPKDRYGNNTSDTMRAASSAMQSVVGSDYALSPKRMEHLWRGYTAGMGMYALHAADWLTRKAEGSPERPDMLLRDFPVVGRFARGSVNPATRFQGDFYDLKDQADAKSAEIKALVEHGDDERAAELEQKWGWLLGERTTERVSKNTKGGYMYTGVREANRIEKQLSALRKADSAIYADPDMSGAEKRQKLNENAMERNAITRDAVKGMRRRQRAASSQ